MLETFISGAAVVLLIFAVIVAVISLAVLFVSLSQ